MLLLDKSLELRAALSDRNGALRDSEVKYGVRLTEVSCSSAARRISIVV